MKIKSFDIWSMALAVLCFSGCASIVSRAEALIRRAVNDAVH